MPKAIVLIPTAVGFHSPRRKCYAQYGTEPGAPGHGFYRHRGLYILELRSSWKTVSQFSKKGEHPHSGRRLRTCFSKLTGSYSYGSPTSGNHAHHIVFWAGSGCDAAQISVVTEAYVTDPGDAELCSPSQGWTTSVHPEEKRYAAIWRGFCRHRGLRNRSPDLVAEQLENWLCSISIPGMDSFYPPRGEMLYAIWHEIRDFCRHRGLCNRSWKTGSQRPQTCFSKLTGSCSFSTTFTTILWLHDG